MYRCAHKKTVHLQLERHCSLCLLKYHKVLIGDSHSVAVLSTSARRVCWCLKYRVGWKPVNNNPGVWFHKETKAVLVVYVDDLLVVADPKVDDLLWQQIEQVIDFQDPGCRCLVVVIWGTLVFKTWLSSWLS